MPQKKPFITLAQAKEIAADIPTPFHLYDEKGIRENARRVNAAFSWNKGFKEYFAVKATPNPYLLKILQEEGCGVHAAGGPDAGQRGRALCRQAGAAGHRPCAPRHLQQKEPLQHLHAGGRGRVRELGRLLLHGRSDPADEGLDPLLVT